MQGKHRRKSECLIGSQDEKGEGWKEGMSHQEDADMQGSMWPPLPSALLYNGESFMVFSIFFELSPWAYGIG